MPNDKPARQSNMFEESNADLPLFSQTAPPASVEPFVPKPASHQPHLPGMAPDWSELAQAEQQRKSGKDPGEDGEEGEASQPSLI
jgi:hypothetical protein